MILDEREDFCALNLDNENAFNSIDRSVILQQLIRFIPTMVPWFLAMYGRDCKLWVIDSETEEKQTIFAEEGLQQGDPLSPVYFCLAIHHTVLLPLQQHMISMVENGESRQQSPGTTAAFLDDIFLVGPPDIV
jgi:hypothetical protein